MRPCKRPSARSRSSYFPRQRASRSDLSCPFRKAGGAHRPRVDGEPERQGPAVLRRLGAPKQISRRCGAPRDRDRCGAILIVILLVLVDQQLPRVAQGQRLPRLRLERTLAGERLAGGQQPPVRDALEAGQRATRSTSRHRSTPSGSTPSSSLQRAKSTDHPGELNAANDWLVTAFQFRVRRDRQDRRPPSHGAGRKGPPAGDQLDRRPDAGSARKRRDLPRSGRSRL